MVRVSRTYGDRQTDRQTSIGSVILVYTLFLQSVMLGRGVGLDLGQFFLAVALKPKSLALQPKALALLCLALALYVVALLT